MYICFFNDTATTEIYTLSLHDALPICVDAVDEAVRIAVLRRAGVAALPVPRPVHRVVGDVDIPPVRGGRGLHRRDRKSTRLNSSHANISYAVFCLKKKKSSFSTSPPPL